MITKEEVLRKLDAIDEHYGDLISTNLIRDFISQTQSNVTSEEALEALTRMLESLIGSEDGGQDHYCMYTVSEIPMREDYNKVLNRLSQLTQENAELKSQLDRIREVKQRKEFYKLLHEEFGYSVEKISELCNKHQDDIQSILEEGVKDE